MQARKTIKKLGDNKMINVAGTDITCGTKLKSLGVILDSQISFDQQVSSIVKSTNYYIKALRHIRPLLDTATANTVACSIVGSKLDYCNSLLYGTMQKNVNKLQRVQN